MRAARGLPALAFALALALALALLPGGARAADAPPALAYTPLGTAAPEAAPAEKRADALVKGGIYDRPYLFRVGPLVAVGGYLDVAAGYFHDQGRSRGFTFEARRFNLFHSSTIADFLRLLSELEFERGADSISVETALIDLRLHHAIGVRTGILLVPVGRFNLAHDSPRYDLVDRPLVSTRIIPSTWSDVGGGLFGAFYPGRHRIAYELYVINGLGAGLLAADGTRLAAGRAGNRFGSDDSGTPAVAGRVAYTAPRILDLGVSFYAGHYNRFTVEGRRVDTPRFATLVAVDVELDLGRVLVRGEGALALVEVPLSLRELFAARQLGFYLEGVARLARGRLGVIPSATLLVTARLDCVDLNLGRRAVTGAAIGDETVRVTLGLSFRPVAVASFRLGYQYEWRFDPLRNLAASGGVQLGLASYF